MWASVALMATLNLAPEPVSQLKLTNDRFTHNALGWERKDSKQPKVLPGEILILLFDIEGLATNESGLVKYSLGLEVRGKNDKVIFTEAPKSLEATAALGGKRLAASAQALTGTAEPEGTYTMKVTVIDRGLEKPQTVTLERTFEVLPKQLGLVRLIVTFDTEAQAPSIAVPGQNLLVNFAAVGFTLSMDDKKQPSIAVEMQVLDEAGKSVLGKPFRGGENNVTEMYKKLIPMQFLLSLNRPGKFKIVLKVTDTLTKKSAEESLNFVVVESK